MNGSSLNDNRVEKEMVQFQSDISKEDINKLEVNAFNGKIIVVEDPTEVNKCLRKIRKYPVLGFDTESRPSFKKNQHFDVSLIQIATSDEVFLFRINLTGFKKSLINLFEDENIAKVGVSIHDDLQRLRKMQDFEPKSFVELQHMSDEYGIECNSLRKLAAIILRFRMSKAQQLSNWENEKLSEAQCKYGATDAWASLEIYNELNKVEANGVCEINP